MLLIDIVYVLTYIDLDKVMQYAPASHRIRKVKLDLEWLPQAGSEICIPPAVDESGAGAIAITTILTSPTFAKSSWLNTSAYTSLAAQSFTRLPAHLTTTNVS